MKTTSIVESGAVESCPTPKLKQYLAARCGRKSPFGAQKEFRDGPSPEPPRNANARGQGGCYGSAVASELAARGYLNERGNPYAAKSVASMVG